MTLANIELRLIDTKLNLLENVIYNIELQKIFELRLNENGICLSDKFKGEKTFKQLICKDEIIRTTKTLYDS